MSLQLEWSNDQEGHQIPEQWIDRLQRLPKSQAKRKDLQLVKSI